MKKRKVIKLTSSNFEKKISKTTGLVLVECFNNSEGPFIIMEPVLNKLKTQYGQKITHYRINIFQETEIRDRYAISYDFCYLIFKNNEMISQITGLIPYYELMQVLENNLKY